MPCKNPNKPCPGCRKDRDGDPRLMFLGPEDGAPRRLAPAPGAELSAAAASPAPRCHGGGAQAS